MKKKKLCFTEYFPATEKAREKKNVAAEDPLKSHDLIVLESASYLCNVQYFGSGRVGPPMELIDAGGR